MNTSKLGIVGIWLAILVAVLGFLAYEALVIVRPDQQVLILQFGEPKKIVREPGLTYKLPLIQNAQFFDKKLLMLDIPAEEVIASDQKRLVVDSLSRYLIKNPLHFYQTVGNRRVAESRLSGLVRSSLRRILGRETLLSVLSGKRGKLMIQIRDAVNKEASSLGVEMADVRIRRADLPEENSEAIYKRMQTERQREAKEIRAKGNELAQEIRAVADKKKAIILAKAKRDSEILRGEGDAISAKIYNDIAGNHSEFYSFYRTLESYREGLVNKEEESVIIIPPFFLENLLNN